MIAQKKIIARTASVSQVIKGGFCIGCGACSVIEPDIKIIETSFGLYQASLSGSQEQVNNVCPFASQDDESSIAERIFTSNDDNAAPPVYHDPRIGYYRGIYAGHVAESEYRKRGSSGGLTTWVLRQLMQNKEIDGVIHVGPCSIRDTAHDQDDSGALFEYRISYTEQEVLDNAKSRYYPVHMADVLRKIKGDGKRYALVGVPCFIKASHLLATQDKDIDTAIAYRVSIFCGHQKSKAYAEMIGWQLQIHPGQLTGINFRSKDPMRPANQYRTEVYSNHGDINRKHSASIMHLWGLDWGMGFFKPKACDWCDDIAGETADFSCGDAWLPEFINQPEGSNIAVTRNPRITELLEDGIKKNALMLTQQSPDKVYQSQAANYRHRIEGLSFRIGRARRAKRWHPKKRVKPEDYSLSPGRQQVYLIREQLAEQSHLLFQQAKQQQSLTSFIWNILPLELRYYHANRQLIKGSLKKSYQILLYMLRKKTIPRE